MFSRGALALAVGLAISGGGPALARPSMVAVAIEHFAFMPASVKVAEGDVIVFTNNDIVPHTATAADGSWTTGEIAHGRSARVRLPVNAGVEFFCRLHPVMKGHLTITTHGAPARDISRHSN